MAIQGNAVRALKRRRWNPDTQKSYEEDIPGTVAPTVPDWLTKRHGEGLSIIGTSTFIPKSYAMGDPERLVGPGAQLSDVTRGTSRVLQGDAYIGTERKYDISGRLGTSRFIAGEETRAGVPMLVGLGREEPPAAPAAAEVAPGVGPSSNITTPLEPFYNAPGVQRRTQTATATRRPGIGGMVRGVTVTPSAVSQQYIPQPTGIAPATVVKMRQMWAGAKTPEAQAAVLNYFRERLPRHRQQIDASFGQAAATRPPANYYKVFDESTRPVRGQSQVDRLRQLQGAVTGYKGAPNHPGFLAAQNEIELVKPLAEREAFDKELKASTQDIQRLVGNAYSTADQLTENLKEADRLYPGVITPTLRRMTEQQIERKRATEQAAIQRGATEFQTQQEARAAKQVTEVKAKVAAYAKTIGDKEDAQIQKDYAKLVEGLTDEQKEQVPRLKATAATEGMVMNLGQAFRYTAKEPETILRDFVHVDNLQKLGITRAEFLAGLRWERGSQIGRKIVDKKAVDVAFKDMTDDELWAYAVQNPSWAVWTGAPPVRKHDKTTGTVQFPDPRQYPPGTGEQKMWEGEQPTEQNPVRYIGLQKRLSQEFSQLRDARLSATEARRAIVRGLGEAGNEEIWKVVYEKTKDAALKELMEETRKRAAAEFTPSPTATEEPAELPSSPPSPTATGQQTSMSEIEQAHTQLAQGDPTMAIEILKRHGRMA